MKTCPNLIAACLLTVFLTAANGLSALEGDRYSGYAISPAFAINTIIDVYSDYRILPLANAPNPSPLLIPEGAKGYAWFMAEGYYNGRWYPVMNAVLEAQDAQGTPILAQTRELPYEFLTEILRLDTAGVFALPIPSTLIGTGAPGSVETVTVLKANNLTLLPENRQSVSCQVSVYEYTADWGYRIYQYGGAGVTCGSVTATGFAGGGSGAKISLQLDGTSTNPDWSSLRISRRDDVFVGAEVSVGPPTLIDVAETGASATVSFPYETEYEFDLDELDGLGALTAFYLFAEPSIIYASSNVPLSSIALKLWNIFVQLLIESDVGSSIGVSRVSDEAGLDIQGSIDFSVDILEDLPLGLSLGAGVGAEVHEGASLKVYHDGLNQQRFGMSGSWDASLGLGPVSISASSIPSKYFYPQRLNGFSPALIKGASFELLNTVDWATWQSIRLSGSLMSDSPAMNIYGLPGNMQEYRAWAELDSQNGRTLLNNACAFASEVAKIGANAVDFSADNSSFSDQFTAFLEAVSNEQAKSDPFQVQYGFDVEDKSSYTFEVDLEFPIPVFPIIVVKLGGGLEATDSRCYPLSEGYWVQGMPYLQTEMPDPPDPDVSFLDVIGELWDKFTVGAVWDDICDIVVDQIYGKFLKYLPFKGRNAELLDSEGSCIWLTASSLPAEVDSVLSRSWDWESEPARALSPAQRQTLSRYTQSLRQIRERQAGMPYGIGGFFRFEADADGWNEDPLLKIVYTDQEVAGLDESLLAVYWEDAQGVWNHLTSSVVADSNCVYANLPWFSTYTLGIRSPQGAFNLDAVPDSLLADGAATAFITSELLHNNDGTVVANGTLYTVTASRGTILTADADPAALGTQIAALGGTIAFTLQADAIALPISLSVSSTQGNSHSELTLPLYRTAPPAAPVLLSITPEHRALRLVWQEPADPGIVGYRVSYDTDSGAPYTGTSNVNGSDSPVSLGKVNSYTLTGLADGYTYYVAVQAVEAGSLLSAYSNELFAQPALQAAQDLSLEKVATGFKLSWAPVFGATSYKVYRSTDPSAEPAAMTLLGQTFGLDWTDTSPPGEKMFYLVVAVGY